MSEYMLEMKNISKSFGHVQALDSASLVLRKGEVLALMGENGAGKSTLMNILSGSLQPDSGEIYLDGVKHDIKNPIQAIELGIVKIHQELQIVPEMTIAENIFLGRWQSNGVGFVNKRKMHEETRRCLSVLDWDINPGIFVKDLRIAERQLVEIAKAISTDAKIIIMDEPTSALSKQEAEQLFKVIGTLVDEGRSVIYITHRMEEVFRIADSLIVLRDGRYIGSRQKGEMNYNEIISMMVGRSVDQQYPERDVEIGDVIFEVKHLNFTPPEGSFKRELKDISFEVRAGEVLGIGGLAGSGRSEIFECIIGLHPNHSTSEITVNGKPVTIRKPGDAINAGISLATEDRKDTGLVPGRSIGENFSLPQLEEYASLGFMQKRKENEDALTYMRKLRVKAPSPATLASELSGGNQQKVILARWLMTDPKVLLLDEPTRGIDVGAKEEIYLLINELAREGLAIVLVSSDLPEVIGVSDRIITLCEGEITATVMRKDATQELLLSKATRNVPVMEEADLHEEGGE